MAATRKRTGKARLKTHHEKPAEPKPRARPARPDRRAPARTLPAAPRPKSDATLRPKNEEARSVRKASMPTSATSLASDDSRSLAIDIAASALEKKAVGLEILDVAGKVDYADFLVLMSGRSDRQVAALAEGIQETLAKRGRRPLSIEGMPHATWVLMDFGDVVVHVFQEESRSLYDLEGLWLDARRLPVPHDEVP